MAVERPGNLQGRSCALAVLIAFAAGGCSTNQWAARYDEDQLLAERPPPRSYPTAVDPNVLPHERPMADRAPVEDKSPQTVNKPLDLPAVPPAEVQPPAETQQPLAPVVSPLAVVPPALRAAPQQPTASPVIADRGPMPAPGDIAAVAATSQEVAPAILPAPAAAPSPGMTADERRSAIEAQRNVLMAMIEEEVRGQPVASLDETARLRLERELRLLYAAAGRDDDAVAAIEALPEAEREAFKHLLFGLTTLLAEEEPRRAPLKNARVMRSLRAATTALAPASKLEIQKLIFCERVDSFGGYAEFPRSEFQPGQQAILYVEIDNSTAVEKGPHSFETELQGSYQIFDAGGDIVAERQLPLDREACRKYRRDYFLAYRVFMPESIAPGRYRLELTVEDMKAPGTFQGRKFGEGTIEFSVRN